jgi:hypothetical protein
MKPYGPGDQLTLTDASGTLLGGVDVAAIEHDHVLGTFCPLGTFAVVAGLFRRFEEHVEAAALAVLPEIERQIAALNLRIGRSGEPSVPACDVQIYSDGGFSCRPVVPVGGNGSSAHRPTATV